MNSSSGNSSATIPNSSNSLRWAAFLTPEQKYKIANDNQYGPSKNMDGAHNSIDWFITL